jgi:chromatin remodeling complex protein RSC6
MVKTNLKSETKSKKKVKTTENELPVVEETTHIVEQLIKTEEVLLDVKKEETVIPVTETETVTEVQIEESNTEILFNKLINQFQDIQLVMKTLHSNLKVLQKEVLRERKESKKKESKTKKSTKKRSPSGFAKPAPISNELAHFLELEAGSELARTDVTSKVIAYIKKNNLQNPSNKKEIMLDNSLNKLLVPGSNDVVTFFNLQTYLKKHFVVPQTIEAVVI